MPKTDTPLVSVVIPVYNRADLLAGTLASVARQDYRPVEIVVVDDGSEEDMGTAAELAWADFEHVGITLRTHKLAQNSGPAHARNVALGLTAGPLIAFLDSDDLWRPTFLSTLVDLLQRNPSCAVAISGNVCIDGSDQITSVNRLDWAEAPEGVLRTPFETFVKRFSFCTSATLIKRSALDAIGPLDEALKQWEDADLWLRLAKRFDFAYSEALLLCKRGHDANISNSKVDWYESQVRVLLRHLGDVQDRKTRQLAVGQIQLAQRLLQEELLRTGRHSDNYRNVLYNECSPGSLRFRLGHLAIRRPSMLRNPYLKMIKTARTTRRRVQRTPAASREMISPEI